MPGHILVIPKRHVERPSRLTAVERKEIFDTVITFQEKILNKFASGCDVRQNCRPFQKQDDLKIDHLHFHLQPRELYDELYQKCQIYEKNIFHKVKRMEKRIFDLFKK